MAKDNRKKSTAARRSGAAGRRAANQSNRRNSNRTHSTTSSSTHAQHDDRQTSSSSTAPARTTAGQLPGLHGAHAALPQGWREDGGRWYYHTPDGYRLWNNDGRLEVGTESFVHYSGGQQEQDMSYGSAGAAWDNYSRISNQGSASPEPTQGAAEANADRRIHGWSPAAEAEYLREPVPWPYGAASVRNGVDRHSAYPSQAQGTGSTYYSSSLELDGDDAQHASNSATGA